MKYKKIDSCDIGQKILSISYVDWKKFGFSKGDFALHENRMPSQINRLLSTLMFWKG
jgi:hypothetical protein